jgi:peptide/nickel transport system substrate-binding protein
MNRRTFLHTLGFAAGSVGMAAYMPARRVLAGQNDTPAFQLKAPEPNPKHSGTLRDGVNNAPAHFDLHQSGTVANVSAQAPMYDNLIRRDPRDGGQTIVPDLARR